ncbi:MAG TPA: endonuclease/exonuclease/phosphatase family protein [Planctomycetaceae bacterium]|nr:endonuclease/exonuclease/phosphatase family protein [Planctomycetaceae bacterium]
MASERTTTVAETEPPVRPARTARLVWALSGINLTVVIIVMLLVFVVSERWWVSTAMLYLPRAPWAIPSLVLAIAGLIWHRPSLWINVLAFLMVLGPLMEFRAPGFTGPLLTSTDTKTGVLRVVSCNVQAYKPNFADVLREVHQFKPDVVAFQEARGNHPLLTESFPDWYHLHHDYFFVTSRFPLKEIAQIETEAFDRPTAMLVEVETPDGLVVLADLHLMTARRGLKNINKGSLLNGEASGDVESFQILRDAEMAELRQAMEPHVNGRPLIACGDFNTPSSSSLFQEHWGDLKSSFDLAGVGFGYTAPVKTHTNWLSHTPWARIDHILCSPEWNVQRCIIGRSIGSDHHLIAAELVR